MSKDDGGYDDEDFPQDVAQGGRIMFPGEEGLAGLAMMQQQQLQQQVRGMEPESSHFGINSASWIFSFTHCNT